MKIPAGMTESQVIEVIEKIADRYCRRFRFGYYEPEDIRQEAMIIAIDGLERYDGSAPLENFLAVHVYNRLLDFKRDNYHRREKTMSAKGLRMNEKKRAVMNPISLQYVDDEAESNMQINYDIDAISNKLVIEYIDKNISPEFREDYLRFKEGVPLPNTRKEMILHNIKRLFNEYAQGQSG